MLYKALKFKVCLNRTRKKNSKLDWITTNQSNAVNDVELHIVVSRTQLQARWKK